MIVGVDPGAAGAVAYLSDAGELLAVDDMPVDKVQVGKSLRSRLSRHRAWMLFKLLPAGTQVFIEQPEYRPMRRHNPQTGAIEKMNMGVAGAGAFGEMYGAVAAFAVAAGAVLEDVRPASWKAAIGLRGGKDDSRRLAMNQFPGWAGHFVRVKDDGRAEAALIGMYGYRKLHGLLKK